MFDTSYIEAKDQNGNYRGIEVSVINGETQTCNQLELVRQKVRNALSFWVGEWFLDITYGINYGILFSSYLNSNISSEITNTILNVTGVQEIQSMNTNIINNRILSINIVIIAYNQQVTLQLEGGQ